MAPLEFLLPTSSGLQLERLVVLSDQVLLFLHSTQLITTCSHCHQPGIQPHGHYSRTLQDLSWGEWSVRLYVTNGASY